MKSDILESIFQLGPMNVSQISEWLKADEHEVSNFAVELIDEGLIYLEPADGTLWYAESVDG